MPRAKKPAVPQLTEDDVRKIFDEGVSKLAPEMTEEMVRQIASEIVNLAINHLAPQINEALAQQANSISAHLNFLLAEIEKLKPQKMEEIVVVEDLPVSEN